MTAPHHEAADEPGLAERLRVAAAVRAAGHALVGHHHDDGAALEAAELLERATALLATGPDRSRPVGDLAARYEMPEPADGEQLFSNVDRPYSGEGSPLGLDPVIHRRGDAIEAVLTLDAAHEGAPARSHGGVVAAFFDDLFGFVLQMDAVFAFTGELTVRYEAPTPLHVPVTFRAWQDRIDGRKRYFVAEAHAEGVRVATARATFIEVRPTG